MTEPAAGDDLGELLVDLDGLDDAGFFDVVLRGNVPGWDDAGWADE